jgi:sarcosine oxidase subunit beta
LQTPRLHAPRRPRGLVRIQVIGGGALGCSAALALAGRNHEVTLAERATLGSGSTGKAAGILSTFAWNDADFQLIQETRGMVGELISLAMAAGESNARAAWRPTPSIVVAKGERLVLLDQLQARAERFTEEPLRMSAREAGREFGGVVFEPGEEVLVAQEDGVLDAGELVAALRARLVSEGVAVREHRPEGMVRATDVDAVVVAGGAWTRSMLGPAGAGLPFRSYRTQLASVAIPGAAELPIVHDLERHFYERPESDGSILAGDGTELRSFEPDAYDEAGDRQFVESIAERIIARFEGGGEAQVRASWAGLCVGTPDRRPLCGAVPGHEGLFVLTGDNGFGLMRCLALGERLADAVAGRPDASMDPGRFGANPTMEFPLREGFGAP